MILHVLIFFLWNCFSFAKGENYFKQEHTIKVGTIGFTIFTVYYREGICNRQEFGSTQFQYIPGNPIEFSNYPTIIFKEGNQMIVQDFYDKECTQFRSNVTTAFRELGSPENSAFIDKYVPSQYYTTQYTMVTHIDESEIPYPGESAKDNYVRMDYGFYETAGDEMSETCEGEPAQQLWIKTSRCSRNWLGEGEYSSVDDSTWQECDSNNAFIKQQQYADCTSTVFVYHFNIGVEKMMQSVDPTFKLCMLVPVMGIYSGMGCEIGGLPESVDSFTSIAPYISQDLYYKQDERKNECLGTSTLNLFTKTDECAGTQIVHYNEDYLIKRIFDGKDYQCENGEVAVHLGQINKMIMNENDKDCLKLWIYKLDNYYTKIRTIQSYKIGDYSNSVAVIKGIDCDNIDEDFLLSYKKNAFSQAFYYIHDDFCVSRNTLMALTERKYSYKGYCIDGILHMRNYTFSNQCDETFYPVDSTNGFCSFPYYFTCLSYICFDKEMWEDTICSGNGQCVGFDQCDCLPGYAGANCNETSIEIVAWIFFPLIGGLGSLVIIIGIISAIIIGFVLLKVAKQKKELKDFGEIEDIDILLQESKIKKKEDGSEENSKGLIKLSNKEFEIDWKSIELLQQIGAGGSGSIIYKGLWDGKEIAYKVFRSSIFTDENSYTEFSKELEFAISLSHPNVLQFFGCTVKQPNRIGIVMEYCSIGSLQNWVKMTQLKENMTLQFGKKLRLLLEIAGAMNYLKRKNIIHRDLKSDNVLLNDMISAKIMDFGLSRKVSNNLEVLTKRVGTSYYMAPEVNYSTSYTYKVDIFSFSIVMWEIYYEQFNPYKEVTKGKSSKGIEFKVAKDLKFRPKINEKDKKKYPTFFSTMKKCWDANPDERVEWEQIISILTKLLKKQKPMIPKNKRKSVTTKESLKKEILKLKKQLKEKEMQLKTL